MSRTSTPSRLGGVVLALLLPIVASCGSTTGPTDALTQAQLVSSAEAMFRQTALATLDVPRAPTSGETMEIGFQCRVSGSGLTTTIVRGTLGPEEGQIDLDYQLSTTYDECVEGTGAGEVLLDTNPDATGLLGNFTYQALTNGNIEIDGVIAGRVEIRTESVRRNCRAAYRFFGRGTSGSGTLTIDVAGEICGLTFGFELLLDN